jgi:hypothetical protein
MGQQKRISVISKSLRNQIKPNEKAKTNQIIDVTDKHSLKMLIKQNLNLKKTDK